MTTAQILGCLLLLAMLAVVLYDVAGLIVKRHVDRATPQPIDPDVLSAARTMPLTKATEFIHAAELVREVEAHLREISR